MVDTSKLDLSLSDTKINLVLLLNGCFNPIHQNHVRSLETAKHHLISSGNYHVAGGYLIPSHDKSIERKLNVVEVKFQDRLNMCRLAVETSTWIMVDDWMISQDKNHGAQQAQQRLFNMLKAQFPTIHAVVCCGADALPKLKAHFKKELTVCIRDRPVTTFDFDSWFHSTEMKKYHHNIILIDNSTTNKTISSTKIRECMRNNQLNSIIDDLHPSVLAYHQDKGIDYRRPNENQLILLSDFQPVSPDQADAIIGQGRCATVYPKIYQNHRVALKIIRERRQFKHESKILRTLMQQDSWHENIVRIIGIGDQLCVMELCDTDLRSYLTKHRHSPNQTLIESFPDPHWYEWLKQMLAGFIHLNYLGILHRDIKTDNILVSNMILKIADFSVSMQGTTMDRMPVRGSIRHYAPESIENKDHYNEKSDVYMFGCLLYEMAHGGILLWDSLQTYEVVQRRVRGETPHFSAVCSSWYVRLIQDNCWLVDPNQRGTFENLLSMTVREKIVCKKEHQTQMNDDIHQ